MTRQAAVSVENNFRNGLVTEATGLNFPENACTSTYDCIFGFDGSVQRRPGYDFELNYAEKTINRAGGVVNSYLWKNVAGTGDLSLYVVQVGATLYFYETDEDIVSTGAVSSTVSLTTYLASGATTAATLECQYSSGNGLLFVTHPYCEPIRISYDTATSTATATAITIKIRDLEGVDDTLAIDNRPTATLAGLDVKHKYNLYNQGWNTTNLTAWDTSQTTMPSNVDVMWTFKNSSDAFDMATLANVIGGNSPAPKGHFIVTLSNQDRDTVSGLSGVSATTTSYRRPSTSTFFAGRVFYSGINYTGFNAKIYFTQIVERPEQYGFCYQANDPTSEEAADLLPSDGGVIQIQEAGTIFKLVSIVGALIVFAANGTWAITGSTGIGFTATDYTVTKISSINTISATSFVDVAGYPSWWNAEGIYILSSDGNSPKVQSLSDAKIRSYYNDIPASSRLNVHGAFNVVTGVIQWLFRSTAAATPEESYEYDYILNFQTQTGAFYPWTISDSDVTINSLFVIEGAAGLQTIDQIINDAADTIIDDSGDLVVQYSLSNSTVSPTFKYLVSYVGGSSYKFTIAEASNTDYVDWTQYGDDTEYSSYFVSGYKLRGEGIKKFQSNYVKVFSRNVEPTSYRFQSLWDYSLSGNTGRWSSAQVVEHDDENYGTLTRRLKTRGHGVAMQIKVTSLAGMPFDLIGWVSFDTANAAP